MFWFNQSPETIEDHKKFIINVLHRYANAEPGDGGIQLGRYIAAINNKNVKEKFIKAISELLKNKTTKNWLKEELAKALNEDSAMYKEKLSQANRTKLEEEIEIANAVVGYRVTHQMTSIAGKKSKKPLQDILDMLSDRPQKRKHTIAINGR